MFALLKKLKNECFRIRDHPFRTHVEQFLPWIMDLWYFQPLKLKAKSSDVIKAEGERFLDCARNRQERS